YSADTLLLHATGQPGTQWVQEGPDAIGSTVVSYVESRPADGLVVAGTHGNGMFTASFSPASAANEPLSENKVRVTPNPATDFVRLDLDETWKGTGSFSLFDLKGTLVRQQSFNGSQASFDVRNLPKGVYLWSVRGSGRSESGKLIVQ
ncbi:MAG: T9SS type A sorting domain-containing protein, partial [Bacteroidota bacterium]